MDEIRRARPDNAADVADVQNAEARDLNQRPLIVLGWEHGRAARFRRELRQAGISDATGDAFAQAGISDRFGRAGIGNVEAVEMWESQRQDLPDLLKQLDVLAALRR